MNYRYIVIATMGRSCKGMGMTPELNRERREFFSKILMTLDVIKSIKELKAEFRSGRKKHSAFCRSGVFLGAQTQW